MKRRSFLKALLGAATAPAVAALPVQASAGCAPLPGNPLFAGATGRIDGVKIVMNDLLPAGDLIGLRAAAQRELSAWYARRMDEAMFAAFKGERWES